MKVKVCKQTFLLSQDESKFQLLFLQKVFAQSAVGDVALLLPLMSSCFMEASLKVNTNLVLHFTAIYM